jgi:hypothetical protein
VDDLYKMVVSFFDSLARERPEFAEFVKTTNTAAVTKKHRDVHALYRPIGLEIFAEVAAKRAARLGVSIDVAVSHVAKLPFLLGKPPFRGLFWDPTTSTVVAKNRALTRDLVAFSLHEHIRRSPQQLQAAVDERVKGKAFKVASLRPKSA